MNFSVRFLAIFMLALIGATFAHAQPIPDSFKVSKQPIEIEADQLFFDKKRDIAIAKGNVEATQSGKVIFADKVIYYRQEDKVYAIGNVVVMNTDGSTFFADKAKFENQAKRGIAINFKARMKGQGLIAAQNVELIDENTMQMSELVFSPCKICKDNFRSFIPLWQIKAKQATLNKEEEQIHYKDATMEAFGVPIAYTPYLITPAPGAKRKSGFLIPKVTWSQIFGTKVKVPFYWNIAKNMDATIAPTWTQRLGPIMEAGFRHKIKQGYYTIDGSLTRPDKVEKTGAIVSGKDEFRGHYDINGDFRVKNSLLDGYLAVKSKKVLDASKTYLKKYKISDEDNLVTDIHYRQFKHRNYYSLRGLHFQGLRPTDNAKITPAALPLFSSHHEGKFIPWNSRVFVDTNFLNLVRSQGTNYQRGSTTVGMNKPFVMPYGQLVNVSGSIRGDFYNVEQRPITINGMNTINNGGREGGAGRLYPEFAVDWSLPLYNNFNSYNVVIEPVASVILSPNVSSLDKVTNEDSQVPEISAVNLFSRNRYKGLDRVESGHRINYGLRGNISSDYIQNISFIVGQNYRFRKDNQFDIRTGLDGNHSDYVSKVSVQPNDYLFLNHSLRLDEEDLEMMRNEASLEVFYPKWTMEVAYIAAGSRVISPDQDIYKQEISASSWYNFYKEWWFNANIRRKLGKKVNSQRTPMISDGIGLKYLGDCLHAEFKAGRDYTRLNDLKPVTTYSFNIVIPTF